MYPYRKRSCCILLILIDSMVWSPTHKPAVPARAERVLKRKHIKHDVSMWKKWTETNDALLNQFLACRMQSSWWKQCQEGSHSFLCNIPLWLYKFGMQKKIKQFSPPLPQRDLGVQTCSDTLDCGQPILPSAGAPWGPRIGFRQQIPTTQACKSLGYWRAHEKLSGLKCPGSIVGEK